MTLLLFLVSTQTISTVLDECGDNIEAAIKRLGELRLFGADADEAAEAAASEAAAAAAAEVATSDPKLVPGTGIILRGRILRSF
eukprot:scaffold481508_cov45-Prasinocladus_malaysianus.AAC.1